MLVSYKGKTLDIIEMENKMFDIIKKSLIITKNNPILTLAFVIYLIILSLFLPKLANFQVSWLILVVLFGILMLNAGFFAGWLEMVKCAIENSKKDYENDEEKFSDTINLRKHFFEAIPPYIIPVAVTMVLYYVLFLALILLCTQVADKFIGNIDFLFRDIKSLTQSNAVALEYLKNLSAEKLMIIYGWNALFTASIGIFGVLTVFWPSALYYGKNGSKNPFRAFWNSITAIFKKPLGVIGLNIFIAILIMALMSLGGVFALNPITSFIYMILSIYFFVFLAVLIFNYYSVNFSKKEKCEIVKEENSQTVV